MTLVLDVSNNNTIGTTMLKRSGAVGLYCKATQGTTFRDNTYSEHRQVAQAVGIPFGGYLYLMPTSAGNEAQFFLDFALPHKGDLQPVVDAEIGLPDQEAKRALSCLRALEDAGYQPILYSSASRLLGMLLNEPALSKYRMWEADYAPRREPLQHHSTVVLWQFSQSYRVLWRRFDASRLFVPIDSLRIA